MAYNASLYNPYGTMLNQPQQLMQPSVSQQPVNGITFINVDELDSYQMPAGSVSQPLFVDENHFIIKTFDQNGGSSMEAYETNKVPLASVIGSDNVAVTKADLEAFKIEIMEAIHGGHPLADVATEPAVAK